LMFEFIGTGKAGCLFKYLTVRISLGFLWTTDTFISYELLSILSIVKKQYWYFKVYYDTFHKQMRLIFQGLPYQPGWIVVWMPIHLNDCITFPIKKDFLSLVFLLYSLLPHSSPAYCY
jgi:hypothetical protein